MSFSDRPEIYILPLRFSAEEIRKLSDQVIVSHPCYTVTESISPDTRIVITKLVQSSRLQRELRSLHLHTKVIVYHASQAVRERDFLKPDNAWCVYIPHVVSHSDQSGDDYKDSTNLIHTSLLQDSSILIQSALSLTSSDTSTLRKLPTMVRHESSADPASEYFRAMRKRGQGHPKYACQRRAPLICPNERLVYRFHQMKLARTLQGDSIGERAYSTVIASIRAVAYVIESEHDVEDLEGCGRKIVAMVKEHLDSGTMTEAVEIWEDRDINILHSFWNCHGVGAATARDWFYNKNFRDLNDAIQVWDTLPRPIQIGLKYYEDFLVRIPREEVEFIAQKVVEHSNKVVQQIHIGSEVAYEICGGYRRGKTDSGDVDIVLTHADCHTMESLLNPLLHELEKAGILNTIISLHHERDASKASGSGICIALVVISLPPPFQDYHRRLDIIVAPPRSFITAITGWSGSTTLERDLRRYLNESRNWTFDSTGISDTVSGVMMFDDSFLWQSGADIQQLERNLFAFIGLDWIDPIYRNSG